MRYVRIRKPHLLMRQAREGWEYRDWYIDSLPLLCRAAYKLDVPVVRFIDVLAITSPRTQVKKNVKETVRYFRTGTIQNMIPSTRAALAHYEETGQIRGQKTSSFAEALKGNGEAIVLDTWMAVALNVSQKIFEAKWARSMCERRIRYCATVMDITPARFQAALWGGTVLKSGVDTHVPSLSKLLQEELKLESCQGMEQRAWEGLLLTDVGCA